MTPYDINYYIALIVKDENHLIIPFYNFKLKLDNLL